MKYLTQYKKYMPQVLDTLAYCLLPTHFHFLIYIKEQTNGLSSSQFSIFFNAYAQWFNAKKQRYGGLFQRPFKRKRILGQKYLKQVIYYIHRNPMHHKYVENPAHYLYSSYNSIISEKPTLIQRQFVLELFETKENFIAYHKQQFNVDRSLLAEV